MAFASMFIFPFLAFSFLFIILAILIKIALYIFQSIGLFRIARVSGYKYPFIAWIPCISQYIIGRFAKSNQIGVSYSILALLKYLLVIALFFIGNEIIINLFLIYLIIYFVIDMLIINLFYEKVYKNSNVYIILTIVTLGLMKPIFIFMSRIKKLTVYEL